MAAGCYKGGEQAAADHCGLLVSARQPRFGHPGAKPAQGPQEALSHLHLLAIGSCQLPRMHPFVALILLHSSASPNCVPLHACRPAPQALQTLMARQRVAYDFEYFRCVCVFSFRVLQACVFSHCVCTTQWMESFPQRGAAFLRALQPRMQRSPARGPSGSHPHSLRQPAPARLPTHPCFSTRTCHSLDQPADAPVTVLSLGRSLLKETVDVTLPLRPTAPLGEPFECLLRLMAVVGWPRKRRVPFSRCAPLRSCASLVWRHVLASSQRCRSAQLLAQVQALCMLPMLCLLVPPSPGRASTPSFPAPSASLTRNKGQST